MLLFSGGTILLRLTTVMIIGSLISTDVFSVPTNSHISPKTRNRSAQES